MRSVSATPPANSESFSELKARIEAERSGRPFLVYRDDEGRQQLFPFEPGMTEASIGRERSTDLVLGWDDQVSRLHARLERADEDWTIVDDGLSSNGTFVNGQRTTGRTRLTDGDTLRFGATTMVFRAPPAGARQGAAPAGGSPGAGRPLHHPAPRARGPLPPLRGGGRGRRPGRRRGAGRGALHVGRRPAHPPDGALREVRRGRRCPGTSSERSWSRGPSTTVTISERDL